MKTLRKKTTHDAVPDGLVQFVWEVVDKIGGRGTEKRLVNQFKHKLRTARSIYGQALRDAAVDLGDSGDETDSGEKSDCTDSGDSSAEESSDAGSSDEDSDASELDPVAKLRYVAKFIRSFCPKHGHNKRAALY